MKNNFLKISLIAFTAFAFTACKNNEKEATTTEEKEVAETTDMALDYKVDTAQSTIHWKGFKPTETHNGTIGLSEGLVAVNNGNVEAGRFVVDMNSITVLDLEGDSKANLEAHLKGTVEEKKDHFFNVAAYPTATFELTGVTEKEGKTMVSGNLTIRDKTNNIEFPAEVTMEGDKMTLKSEEFMIDRTKWNVNYGSKSIFDNLGDKFINDDMAIIVELYANKA